MFDNPCGDLQTCVCACVYPNGICNTHGIENLSVAYTWCCCKDVPVSLKTRNRKAEAAKTISYMQCVIEFGRHRHSNGLRLVYTTKFFRPNKIIGAFTWFFQIFQMHSHTFSFGFRWNLDHFILDMAAICRCTLENGEIKAPVNRHGLGCTRGVRTIRQLPFVASRLLETKKTWKVW